MIVQTEMLSHNLPPPNMHSNTKHHLLRPQDTYSATPEGRLEDEVVRITQDNTAESTERRSYKNCGFCIPMRPRPSKSDRYPGFSSYNLTRLFYPVSQVRFEAWK